MNKLLRLALVLTSTTSFSLLSYATESSADDRNIYFGGEYGLASPVVKSFKHKVSTTEITLKKSQMFSLKAGYGFYPGISIEFSATYHPKYKLSYLIPATPIGDMFGETKVNAQIYMLNMVYDFYNPTKFTPFLIAGAGVAKITVKPTSFNHFNQEVFRINKTPGNYFAWQVGLGVSTEIAPNFTIDLAAKLQVINHVKVKYESFDLRTGRFNTQKSIKKTLGTSEFGVGFTYKLPI